MNNPEPIPSVSPASTKEEMPMIPIVELEALGLYGPARCTCLDDEQYFPGRRSVFCIFCEAVEDWKETHEAK